ncbi:MAG: hypothetical protein KGJ93_03275 [Patescibacteria group bacterium]|nr:hypothetical protein [Patescibacteria group bacterium]
MSIVLLRPERGQKYQGGYYQPGGYHPRCGMHEIILSKPRITQNTKKVLLRFSCRPKVALPCQSVKLVRLDVYFGVSSNYPVASMPKKFAESMSKTNFAEQ